MATTIRDINPSDTISSMVDKINYNFDLLASDFGLQGVQGIQGVMGPIGLQGDEGMQGLRGSRWFVLQDARQPQSGDFPDAAENDICINADGEFFIFDGTTWQPHGDLSILDSPFMKSGNSDNIVYRGNFGGVIISNNPTLKGTSMAAGLSVDVDSQDGFNAVLQGVSGTGNSCTGLYFDADLGTVIKTDRKAMALQTTQGDLRMGEQGNLQSSFFAGSHRHVMVAETGDIKQSGWIADTSGALAPEDDDYTNKIYSIGKAGLPVRALYLDAPATTTLYFRSRTSITADNNSSSLAFIDRGNRGIEVARLFSGGVVIGDSSYDTAKNAGMEGNGNGHNGRRTGIILSANISKSDNIAFAGGGSTVVLKNTYNISKPDRTTTGYTSSTQFERSLKVTSFQAFLLGYENGNGTMPGSLYGFGSLILGDNTSDGSGSTRVAGGRGSRGDADNAVGIYGASAKTTGYKGGDVIIAGGYNRSAISSNIDSSSVALGGNVYITGGSHVSKSDPADAGDGNLKVDVKHSVRESGNVIIGMSPVVAENMDTGHTGANHEGTLNPDGVRFFPTETFAAHANNIILDSDANARKALYSAQGEKTRYYIPRTLDQVTFNLHARNTLYHHETIKIPKGEQNAYSVLSGVMTQYYNVKKSADQILHNLQPLDLDYLPAVTKLNSILGSPDTSSVSGYWVWGKSETILEVQQIWQKTGGVVSVTLRFSFVEFICPVNGERAYTQPAFGTDSTFKSLKALKSWEASCLAFDYPISVDGNCAKMVWGTGTISSKVSNHNSTSLNLDTAEQIDVRLDSYETSSPIKYFVGVYPVTGYLISGQTDRPYIRDLKEFGWSSTRLGVIEGTFHYSYTIYHNTIDKEDADNMRRPVIGTNGDTPPVVGTGTGNGGNNSALGGGNSQAY